MTDKPPEVWLRGPLPGVPSVLQPVGHALLQAREEVEAMMRGFPEHKLWSRPAGVAEHAAARGDARTAAERPKGRAGNAVVLELDVKRDHRIGGCIVDPTEGVGALHAPDIPRMLEMVDRDRREA